MSRLAPHLPAAPPSPSPRALADERAWLEALHRRFHHRRFVHPDPLEFLYRYDDVADREVVGLVASGLAYGNVTAMLPAIEHVLGRLGPRPARLVEAAPRRTLAAKLRGFRYRFTAGTQLTALLAAVGSVRREFGSLEACLAPQADDGPTILPALGRFVHILRERAPRPLDHLLPSPADGSACKRLHLYLRWMVRRDAIDPGGWTSVHPRTLVMPLDTHVFATARARGWTTRRTPGRAAALEVTAALRRIAPADPLRYDFSITRPGIRGE